MSNMAFNFEKLAGTRDLSVPDWGPYGRLYAGVSHLVRRLRRSADFMFAFRADGCTPVLPYFADSTCRNFHAFGASPRLSRFVYKFDLEGIEDLVAIVEFRPAGDACAAEVRLTNRTGRARSVEMEVLAVIPPELCRPTLPELNLCPGDVWVAGEDYAGLDTWVRRMEDGFRNLVKFDRHAVGSRCLSGRWAIFPGTTVTYQTTLGTGLSATKLGIRYRRDNRSDLRHFLVWNGHRLSADFTPGNGYRWLWIDLGDLRPGPQEFSLLVDPQSRSGVKPNLYGLVPGYIEVDGFVITAHPRDDLVRDAEDVAPAKVRSREVGPGRFALSSDLLGGDYAVGAEGSSGLALSEAPVLFAGAQALEGAARLGCLRSKAIHVPAGGEVRLRLALARGADEHAALAGLDSAAAPKSEAELRSAPVVPERFELGHRLLAANCLMNVSYPCFLPTETVATYTPGKTWGGFYSWDAGMHGLGLLEVDPRAAVECLNTYLCAPEDPVDFIWHGTPLPVQAYLFNELWMRTRDRELLGYFYPRLRKFYDYLAGHTPGSPTNRFGTGLLNTYPLFYNTGGWDDLPPQREVHARSLQDEITPVASTAHVVRFARFMRRFALELGRAADAALFDADIARGLAAIERTWDPAEGVYSYVRHRTFEPFRHESGWNYNHTLDALTPLLAGGVDAARAGILLERLGTPGRYWSAVGVSTVDQAAPYYDTNGYWNGSVWIPHQWFMWRAALDWGDVRLSRLIPRQAAEVWEREARRTHCSSELFKIETGLGGGYPHFAGLSSPVLGMIAAISRPGRVTPGFDSEVRAAQLDGRTLSFEYRTNGPAAHPAFMAVMPTPGGYDVGTADGAGQVVETDDLGCAAFRLPRSENWNGVEISPA